MRLRIDIGIDAEGDAGRDAAGAGNLAQSAKLSLGLDVEAENSGVERESHFGPRFADTREDDLMRRHSSRQRAMNLAL